MTLRMLWFLPVSVATGLGGLDVSRYLHRQGGKHRTEARFVLMLTWLPLALWLLNQVFTFER